MCPIEITVWITRVTQSDYTGFVWRKSVVKCDANVRTRHRANGNEEPFFNVDPGQVGHIRDRANALLVEGHEFVAVWFAARFTSHAIKGKEVNGIVNRFVQPGNKFTKGIVARVPPAILRYEIAKQLRNR